MEKNSKGLFLTRGASLAEKYLGKHVAVVDDKIKCSGRNRLEVYKKAIKGLPGHKSVGIFYLPREREVAGKI